MTITARAIRIAEPVSASGDRARDTATAAMPASPMTTAATRAMWPETVGETAPASSAEDWAGASAAAAASSSNPASQPRSTAPPEWKVPRSDAMAYTTFVTHSTAMANTTPTVPA